MIDTNGKKIHFDPKMNQQIWQIQYDLAKKNELKEIPDQPGKFICARLDGTLFFVDTTQAQP